VTERIDTLQDILRLRFERNARDDRETFDRIHQFVARTDVSVSHAARAEQFAHKGMGEHVSISTCEAYVRSMRGHRD
jgi:hypothetical protein